MEHLNSCNICMDHFNEDVRPRVLPCGHDLCGSCITKSIKRGSLACPQCQHSHRATTESDFPINYRVESLLSAIKHPLSPVVSQKSSRGKGEAGKKWQALFNEEKDNLKDLIATCEDMKADYLEYEHLLSQRRDEHEGCLPRIQDLIYKNQEIMKHIDGEKKRLSGILKEGEERKKCALGILCKYNSVIKTKDIIHGSDEVERCFNSLQEWKEQCERMIPNVETFTLSEKLLQQTEVALMEMSHDDEKAETDFLDLSGSSFSTVEKVQWITGKPLQVPVSA
ncbi:hypothetical protein SK128_003170 [Halocaridina rubra]|uniref:RING-type domain-containing protein n=1 Tax=Halocaridina rubra TaxID=373956 RepID=A0AAN8ZT03_HALRR